MKIKKYIWLSAIPVAFLASSCSGLLKNKIEFKVDGEVVISLEEYSGQGIAHYVYRDMNKKGYIVDEWYKDESLTERWDFDLDVVEEDMVLYGKEPNKVTYYNGFTEIDTEYVRDGDMCNYIPDIFVKDGYHFDDWYTEFTFNNKFSAHNYINEDTNLYAKIEKNPYYKLDISYHNSKEGINSLYRDQDLDINDFTIKAYYGDLTYDSVDIDDPELSYEVTNFNEETNELGVTFNYDNISTTFFVPVIDNKCIKFEIEKEGNKSSLECFDILNPDFSNYQYSAYYNYGQSKSLSADDLIFQLQEYNEQEAIYSVYDKKNNKLAVIYATKQLYTDISKFNYSLNMNNEIEIYGLKVNTESLSNIFINDSYYIGNKKYKVGVIGSGAFKNNHVLNRISLPKTLKVIGNNAFEGNDKLEVVNYEGEELNIQNEAFKNCISLKDSSIIEKSKKIGDGAFKNCVNITSPVFNSAIENIGAETFLGCSSITEIDLNNIKTIGASAFEGCTSLSKVSMPLVTEIGDKAFAQTKVEKIKISEQTKIGKTIFENNTSVVNLDIESSLTLKDLFGAFIPTSIQSITLHNPVEKQLEGLTNLNELTIYNYNDKTIGSIFSSSESGNTYEVIQGTGTYYLPKNLEKVSIDSKSLGDYVFANCNSIKEINFLNQQPTIIPDNAFFNCLALKTINIDFTKVTEIGNNAFQHCNNLIGDLKLDVVTVIGENAFEGTLFKNIYIGKDCALIGNNAFYNIDNLETIDVNIENNVYFIKYNCLYEKITPNKYILVKCPNLINIVPKVIDGTVEIKANAFYECKQDMLILETVFYPVIDKDAFKDSSFVRINAYNVMKDTFENDLINGIHVNFQNADYDKISLYLLNSKTNEITDVIKVGANNILDYSLENIVVKEILDYKGNKIDFTQLEDGSIKIYGKLSRDQIIKCKFEIKKYKITYQYDGKEEYQMVGFDLNIEYKEAPLKEDYEFVKWVDKSTEETYDKMPGKNITLIPIYNKVMYKVNYELRDGTTITVKNKINEPITKQDAPLLEDYEFVKWVDKSTGEEYDVMPEKDITLIPQYKKVIFKAKFILPDGTEIVSKTKVGDEIKLPNNPVKEDYEFVCWIDKLTNEEHYVMPEKDIILIPKFKKIIFNVTFIQLDGTETVSRIKVGESIVFPQVPNKEDYEFVCWIDRSTNEEYDVMPEKDITLIPKYKKVIFNVTFIYPDGTKTVSRTKVGDKIIFPDGPAKENYDFIGWLDETSREFYKFMPEKDITLTPKWVKSIITITYEFDDGQTQEVNVKPGSIIEYPYPGQKRDFVFMGWIDKNTGEHYEKVPEEDVILIASWKYIYVIIKFVTNSAEQVSNMKVKYTDTNITLPTLSPVKGVKFLGWTFDLKSNYTPIFVLSSIEIDKNITLYAVYDGFMVNYSSTETYTVNIYREDDLFETRTVRPGISFSLYGDMDPYLISGRYHLFHDYYIETQNEYVTLTDGFEIRHDLDIYTSWSSPLDHNVISGDMYGNVEYYYKGFQPSFDGFYYLGARCPYVVKVTVSDGITSTTTTVLENKDFLYFEASKNKTYDFTFKINMAINKPVPTEFYIFEDGTEIFKPIHIRNNQDIDKSIFVPKGKSFTLSVPKYDENIYKFEGYFAKNGGNYEQITDKNGMSIKTFNYISSLDLVARYSIV